MIIEHVRRLRRGPLFFLAVCAVIAVSVGGNTAMFAVLNAVVLRPLAVADEAQLVAIHISRPGTPRGPIPSPLLDELRTAGTTTGVAAAFQWSANLADEVEAERLQAMRVSGNYFPLLGARVALGRPLSPEDAKPGSAAVALIGDGLWKRKFGASPSAIGQQIRLNGELFTIAGVLPADFTYQIRDAEIVTPWVQERDPRRTNPALGFLRAVARVAPGHSMSQVQTEMASRLRKFRETYPQAIGQDQAIAVVPLREDLLGNSARMVTMLSVAMGVVLLIALANLTNLFLVHAAGRRQEFATRRALGASGRQMFAQLMTESLIPAAAGTLLGLLTAAAALKALLASGATVVPRSAHAGIDASAVAFAIASGLTIALVAMLSPALQLSRSSRAIGAQRWATVEGRRARAIFVGAQVALSVVLVICAGLLVRSFAAVQRVDPGFQAADVLTLRLSLPRAQYPETASLARFTTDLAERVRTVPGVVSVAAANVVPMNGYLATSAVGVPGVESQPVNTWPQAHYRMISPDYFSVMGIPLTGRAFADSDHGSAAPVGIISRGFAEHFWPGRSPVGERLKVRDNGETFRELLIVGIAGDVRHFGLEAESPHELYVPIPQVPDATSVWLANNMYWVAKTTGNPLTLATPVKRQVAAIDRGVAASFVRSMDQWLDMSVQARRFNVQVIIAFGLAALLLTSLGVYGVASEAVMLRTREIGVRAALGATSGQLRRMIITSGLRPVLLGISAGLVSALAASNLLASFLFGVAARDIVTFATVPAIVLIVGALAFTLPAWRVSRIDPVITLRGE